jgi:hypothetical protein
MFCPKCGQQQPAEGMRFCSRCGFTMSNVSLLVESNGVLPQPPAPTRATISRNRIMIEGAMLTVFGWTAVFIASFWFDASGRAEGISQISALIFAILGFIGLFRFLYGFLFVKDAGQTAALPASSSEYTLPRSANYAALPPQQSVPISDYPLRPNTKEMSPRPSVTENTTRLLDE